LDPLQAAERFRRVTQACALGTRRERPSNTALVCQQHVYYDVHPAGKREAFPQPTRSCEKAQRRQQK